MSVGNGNVLERTAKL